jgi:hypothetical protein
VATRRGGRGAADELKAEGEQKTRFKAIVAELDRWRTGTRLGSDSLRGCQPFHWVTVYGEMDPTVVAREWSYLDLMDHYYRLRIKDLTDSA